MQKENSAHTSGEPSNRITRAQAAALRISNATDLSKPPLRKPPPTKVGNKICLRRKSKAPQENAVSSHVALPSKRKMALRDVTNIAQKNATNNCCDSSYRNYTIVPPVQQRRKSQRCKLDDSKATSKFKNDSGSFDFSESMSVNEQLVIQDEKDKFNEDAFISHNGILIDTISGIQGNDISNDEKREHIHDSNIKIEICEAHESLINCKHINIDSDHSNPQLCNVYVAEIYANLRIQELDRRPYSAFMETVQSDITESMRSILVDWLVEVAEEYKLVPDTLYLTVHILDQFLSQNYIERQRLQLLGITCMLIAAKYEEICAPRVEKFCFITDNTYTAEDVRKMEKQVLNHMGFRLSVPTVKTFLRRFLRAAQASFKSPTLVLEFMANYLVELTLIEYAFLKFTPSLVAASAVFLARWTLDQSGHPWNSTLEHYTCYRVSDLKASVIAMHGLQQNSNCCPLGAIREKYRQLKFKHVANLPTQELLPSLFMQDRRFSSELGC